MHMHKCMSVAPKWRENLLLCFEFCVNRGACMLQCMLGSEPRLDRWSGDCPDTIYSSDLCHCLSAVAPTSPETKVLHQLIM